MAVADPVVTTAWLAKRLGKPGVSIIDASWFMPDARRDPRAEFLARRIPGARFFDVEEIRDQRSALPHMLAPPAEFAAWARSAGVTNAGTIAVYDAHGLFSAARLWWNLRAMGARRVFVLDGGLPAWLAEGRATESGPPAIAAAGDFEARFDPGWVRSLAEMSDNLQRRTEQVVDARSAARFWGRAPEPRPGLRSGHIPRSVNLPWEKAVDDARRLRPVAELAELFTDAELSLDRPIVASCGSGVTAAILALALARLGKVPAPVYDGSWSEWGARADTPVVTGGGS